MLNRLCLLFASLTIPAAVALADTHGIPSMQDDVSTCSDWKQPTDAYFNTIIGKDKAEFLDRVLFVIENEVVPKTMEGVRAGPATSSVLPYRGSAA